MADDIAPNQELLDAIALLTVDEIYLATNQDAVRGARIAQLYRDKPWLTGILVSHEIGYRKPDRAFFGEALRRIGRRPDECLFVDDNETFVAGAIAAGLPSIRFRGNHHLMAALAAYGLLPGRHDQAAGNAPPGDRSL